MFQAEVLVMPLHLDLAAAPATPAPLRSPAPGSGFFLWENHPLRLWPAEFRESKMPSMGKVVAVTGCLSAVDCACPAGYLFRL